MGLIYNLLRSTTGSAGIMAIITMVLLGTIGAAYIALSSTEGRIATNFRDGTAAQYLAEDGAMWAMIQLDTNRGNNATLISATDSASGHSYTSATKNPNTSTAGIYTVKITRDPSASTDSSKRQIISTGTANGASRQVVMKVMLGSVGTGGIYSYAGFGGSSLKLYNDSVINGDVGTNSNVEQWQKQNGGIVTGVINHSGSYNGDLNNDPLLPIKAPTLKNPWALTQLTVAINKNKTDTALDAPITLSAPPVPSSHLLNDSAYYQSGSTLISSSIYSGSGYNNMSGTYYVASGLGTGNTTFTVPPGNSAVIYANGDMQLNSGTVINASGNLTLIANGTVQLNSANLSSTTGSITIYAKTIQMDSSVVSASNITMWADNNILLSSSTRIAANGGTTSICANAGYFQDSYNGSDASSAISGGTITIWANTAVDLSNNCRLNASNGPVSICANSGYFHDSYNGTEVNPAISGSNISIWAKNEVDINNHCRLIASNGLISICANTSYFHDNYNGNSSYTAINGGNINIWANTQVEFNNNCQIVASSGATNIYANTGYFHANTNSSVTAQNITIMTGDEAELNGNSFLSASGKTLLYAKTNFQLNENSQISGNALVTAGGNVALNGGTSPKTAYIAGGNAQVSSNMNGSSGPIYAVGILEFDGGTINYDSALMQSLGLNAGSSPFAVTSIKNQ